MVPGIPFAQVVADDELVGKMAADHFLRRGFEHFACVYDESGFGMRRSHAFRTSVNNAGYECSIFDTDPNAALDAVKAHVARNPSNPIALFAINDGRAVSMVNRCLANRVAVPQEAAVLGVDNDPIVTLCCALPLSSIELPRYRIGREAARILVDMTEGAEPPDGPVLIPPTRLVVRASSDIMAASDPVLDRAMEFIRANAARPIGVDDVVAACGVSGRRTLERLFERKLNTTLAAEIRAARLERAKQLLETGSFSIKEVTYMCGFDSPSSFSRTFTACEGMSPSEFRQASDPQRA
jgi:LacI family transcriptional regulator